jgi:hypothetical protein
VDRPLDPVFTDPSQIFELARVVKLLVPVAHELDSPGTAKGKREIEKLASHVETTLLERFCTASEVGNLAKMKEIAEALTVFNGGDSLVARFIQTRKLFRDMAEVRADEAAARAPIALGGGPADRIDDPRLAEFFRKIVRELQREHGVIVSVFPKPTAVTSLLVQKTLELRVRPFIDAVVYAPELIGEAATVPKMAYVRVLHNTYVLAQELLVKELRQYSETAGGAQMGTFIEAFFSTYLWPCTADGKPHPNSYISKELEAMAEFYNEGLKTFDAKKRQLEKRGIRERPAGEGTMPGEAADELVSIQTILEFIHANDAATMRCTVLSRKLDTPMSIGNLFRLLLQFVFLEYCDDAVTRMAKQVTLVL